MSLAPSTTGYTFSEQLLFVTGRPVLFVPVRGSFATLGRHIVVAWNSSRTAARAVNDALPLIDHADRVTVVAVNPAEFAERYGALPPQKMLEHLQHHGAEADGIWLDKIPTASIALRRLLAGGPGTRRGTRMLLPQRLGPDPTQRALLPEMALPEFTKVP